MRNFYDVLHNFISPVTGHVLADPDYVLVGNDLGIAIPSPDLIDLRLDQINLRMDFDTLSSAYFIVGFENAQLPNAQVLYNMSDGYLYNTAGIVSTTPTIPIGALPNLTEHNIWVGNNVNRPVETQRLSVLNLPAFLTAELINPLSIPPGAPVNFGLNNLYMGGVDIPPNPSEFVEPGIGLRVDPSNLPNLSRGKMWLGVINAVPPIITFSETPPYVHVTGSLNWDGRGALVPPFGGNDYAVPQEVGLNPNELFVGSTNALYYGEITKTVALNIVNLPNLTEGKVWQGDFENRPVEVSVASNNATYIVQKADAGLPNAQSLGTLSTGLLKNNYSFVSGTNTGVLSIAVSGVDYINLTQYEFLEGQIETLDGLVIELFGDVALLQFEVARLQEEIVVIVEVTIAALAALVTALEGQVIALQGEITTINTKIDTLSSASYVIGQPNAQLPNAQVLNGMGNGYMINTGGVVSTTTVSPGGDITLTGFVTGGPPVDSVISTTRTPGDLDMGGDRVKNLRQDPVEDLDAVSMTFLWNILNGELEILWP